MNVELHIEELVLHGFPPGDHQHIGDAVKLELSRLLRERGVPPSLASGTDTPHLDAGAFEMGPSTGAEAAGEQIARSLYGGITR